MSEAACFLGEAATARLDLCFTHRLLPVHALCPTLLSVPLMIPHMGPCGIFFTAYHVP